MNGLIIYKGKYGATRQYAQWVAEELKIPAAAADELEKEKLQDYDVLLIGTSVYIGKLQIQPWLKNNLALLRNKKIFFFLVSATPPDEKEKLNQYIKTGIPEDIRSQCEIFYLHGKMIMKELSWKDRFLLKIGARLAKDPQNRKNMLTDFNSVKKENIAGIIAAVRKFLSARDTTVTV